MSGCDGKCCVAFYLSAPLEELRERADSIEDGAYILDMLVPLTTEQAVERCAAFGVELNEPDVPRFTCRHFDETTMQCGAYDSRPAMCRHYPYGKDCEHGCDCKDKRPLRKG